MTTTADTIAICGTRGRVDGPGAAAFEVLACAARSVMDLRGRLPSPVSAPHREAAGVAAC